jgi:hypothetical protein
VEVRCQSREQRRKQGHFVAGLRRRQRAGELERLDPEAVDGMLDALMATDWVVYAKSCLGHTESVLAYLARYTHRTALSDQRLIGIEGERVGLRYTDHRDGQRKALWLDATELIRRFLLHVLPKGLIASATTASLPTAAGASVFAKSVTPWRAAPKTPGTTPVTTPASLRRPRPRQARRRAARAAAAGGCASSCWRRSASKEDDALS